MIRVIIRPMYQTDQNYRKGMQVAVHENTTDGSWIARHSDNILKSKALNHLKEINANQVHLIYLTYDEIDWANAGYNVK
jgi:hypothetical protein